MVEAQKLGESAGVTEPKTRDRPRLVLQVQDELALVVPGDVKNDPRHDIAAVVQALNAGSQEVDRNRGKLPKRGVRLSAILRQKFAAS